MLVFGVREMNWKEKKTRGSGARGSSRCLVWEWGNYVGCPLAPLLNRDAASPRRYKCVKAICAVRSLKCSYVLEVRMRLV